MRRFLGGHPGLPATTEGLVELHDRYQFADLGLDILAGTPEEFDSFIRSEIARWSRLGKQAGITIE